MNKKRIIVFLIIPCILTACNRNTSEQSIADDEQSISDGNAENMLVVLSEDNFPDARFGS